jgi:hypothetical protein
MSPSRVRAPGSHGPANMAAVKTITSCQTRTIAAQGQHDHCL